ncbi:hypothetical protein Q7O_003761 [Pectobacterium carotovorum subsp. carotovorum PCCS1]|nr:hypothetical protein [Pectobacterium carotovorum subsp. carotovorum PCCS1]
MGGYPAELKHCWYFTDKTPKIFSVCYLVGYHSQTKRKSGAYISIC